MSLCSPPAISITMTRRKGKINEQLITAPISLQLLFNKPMMLKIIDDRVRATQRKRFLNELTSRMHASETSSSAPKWESRMVDIPTETFPQLISTMVCSTCQRIPLPDNRFLCRKGHHFCGDCGERQVINHGFKCMRELGTDGMLEASSSSSNNCNEKGRPPGEATRYHFSLCQERIWRAAADPIYKQVYENTVWKCPIHPGGDCDKKVMPGSEIQGHIEDSQSNGNLKDEKLDQTENMEDLDKTLTESDDLSTVGYECGYNPNRIKDLIEHFILDHGFDAADIGNNADGGKWTVRIPVEIIEKKQPYSMILRYQRRFFLFCMRTLEETDPSFCFWIYRLSNMNNEEGEKRPHFQYYLHFMDKSEGVKLKFTKNCVPWSKKWRDVTQNNLCLILHSAMTKLFVEERNGSMELTIRLKIYQGSAKADGVAQEETPTSSMESIQTLVQFAGDESYDVTSAI